MNQEKPFLKKEAFAAALLFLGIGVLFEIPMFLSGPTSDADLGRKGFVILIILLCAGIACFAGGIFLLRSKK